CPGLVPRVSTCCPCWRDYESADHCSETLMGAPARPHIGSPSHRVPLLGRRYKEDSAIRRCGRTPAQVRTTPHSSRIELRAHLQWPCFVRAGQACRGKMPGSDQSEEASTPDTVDRIVADLVELRTNAGVVPYAEIARRIGRRRERAGNQGPSHVPARSTIYDAFRSGRRRLDAELVGDIVIALGEDEQSAQAWKKRCFSVQAANERRARSASEREVPAPETVAERIPDDAPRRILPLLGVMIACVLIDGVGHA